MPRTRSNLTLNAIWDLEDQYTALAGSASGRAVVAPRAEAVAAPVAKTVSPKRISRTEKVIHAVTEGIKTGITKSGIYGVKIKKHGASGLKAKKPKLAPVAPGKTKVG